MVSWWIWRLNRVSMSRLEPATAMPPRQNPPRPPRTATTQARAVYETDLTDAQWEILRPLLPPPPGGGRPPKTDRREVVNAIQYVLRTGCAWDLLPHDFPPPG